MLGSGSQCMIVLTLVFFVRPLIEKACAKLFGDYAALNSGCSACAIEDMTGYLLLLRG
jgi:hypothetical protein